MPMTEIGSSERILDELRSWVEMETPSTDPAAVTALAAKAEAELRAVGGQVERIPGRDGFGDILVCRTPGEGKPVLVAGHLDTVWDHGTLAGPMPWRVEGDKAYGPGIYDMKAGSFFAFHSVREILRQKVKTKRPITLLLTPDEERGSPTSRAIIEAEALKSCAVLIPEPAGGPGGGCVTARKGSGYFHMRIKGRSAHAGSNFSEGRSAVVALARKILEIDALNDPEGGITANVAPIFGGTRSNVVPPDAGCEINVRIMTMEQGERIERLIRAMAGDDGDGIVVTVTGGIHRPPMEESPGALALHARAKGFAAEHGYDLPKYFRGGASDGNFTAALGVPTLDGLGCTGAGAHAPHEHVIWTDLAPRCATLCALLETIEG